MSLNWRDKRSLEDATNEDRTLRCGAHGCPNNWSVDACNGRLCSAHAWADMHDWPAITDRQQCLVADRAIERARPKPAPRHYTRDDKRELLQRLRDVTTGQAGRRPKAWAHDLRDREDAGEVLSLHQRQCWREALGRGADVVDAVIVERPAAMPAAIPLPAPRPRDAEAEYSGLPPVALP